MEFLGEPRMQSLLHLQNYIFSNISGEGQFIIPLDLDMQLRRIVFVSLFIIDLVKLRLVITSQAYNCIALY